MPATGRPPSETKQPTQLSAAMAGFVSTSMSFSPAADSPGSTGTTDSESRNGFQPEETEASLDDQRHAYAALCRHFAPPRPASVESRDITLADGTRLRRYRPVLAEPAASLLFLHGGGFVLGDLDSHDDVCAEWCAETGFQVIAVEYRLAPQHRHPAALQDCRKALEWLGGETPGPLLLAGDSAGAWLAAMLVHGLLAEHNPLAETLAGLILIYPALGGMMDMPSFRHHATAPLLTTAALSFYYSSYFGPDAGPPWPGPLQHQHWQGAPPTLIISAGCDPLADDGPAFARLLAKAGCRVSCRVEHQLVHGFLRARHSVEEARAAMDNLLHASRAMARGDFRPVSA